MVGLEDEVTVGDMEDLCLACQPIEREELKGAFKPATKRSVKKPVLTKSQSKQTRLPFAPPIKADMDEKEKTMDQLPAAQAYAQFFPLKKKETVKPEAHVAVCFIRTKSDGHYALEQRPSTGLLASMWQFPCLPLDQDDLHPRGESKALEQKVARFASGVVHATPGRVGPALGATLKWAGESLTHVFSHLRLHMHLFFLVVDGPPCKERANVPAMPRRWACGKQVDDANMGTGMVNAWKLHRKTHGRLLASVNSSQ